MAKVKLRKRRAGGGYYSYEVTLPKDIIEALGWREGIELEVRIIEVEGEKAVALVPRSTG